MASGLNLSTSKPLPAPAVAFSCPVEVCPKRMILQFPFVAVFQFKTPFVSTNFEILTIFDGSIQSVALISFSVTCGLNLQIAPDFP